MRSASRAQGFTLVELLVVISIIVVLMAILFPAFQSAREKARQTRCISNMHQIDIALKSYLQDYHRFPTPPYYDATAQKYFGGVDDLYPDYIQSHETFVCPADRKVDGVEQAAKANGYSSYNGIAEDPQSDKWDFVLLADGSPSGGDYTKAMRRLYNWGGYTADGYDDAVCAVAAPHRGTSEAWALGHDDAKKGAALPIWLKSQNMGWKSYPRLSNRRAPDNTIVLHCASHRDFYKAGDEIDPVVRLGGDATTVKLSDMAGVDGAGFTSWQTQVH